VARVAALYRDIAEAVPTPFDIVTYTQRSGAGFAFANNIGHAQAQSNVGAATVAADQGHAAATANQGHAIASDDIGHAASADDIGHANGD
jgi:hypothetical protein